MPKSLHKLYIRILFPHYYILNDTQKAAEARNLSGKSRYVDRSILRNRTRCGNLLFYRTAVLSFASSYGGARHNICLVLLLSACATV